MEFLTTFTPAFLANLAANFAGYLLSGTGKGDSEENSRNRLGGGIQAVCGCRDLRGGSGNQRRCAYLNRLLDRCDPLDPAAIDHTCFRDGNEARLVPGIGCLYHLISGGAGEGTGSVEWEQSA